MLVRHLMTPNPIPIGPHRSVAEAAEIMTEKGIRHLPVMDDQGKLLGLVTRSSIGRALPGLGTGLTRFEVNYLTSSTRVDEVMIRNPLLTSEDEAAEEAARLMNVNRISSLIVMGQGRPVGIITDTDIFEAMLELLGAKRPGVRVTVHLPNRPGQLSQVANVIAGEGGNISAVGAWEVSPEQWGAMIKVENMDPASITTAVERVAGITVVDARG